ncbi:DUF6074 family protein [Pseudaminobacter salicylatoxidans]
MDLFDIRVGAEIVAFPIDRQLVRVRRTARQLEQRTGALAEKFWKTECNRLYARLQVQGLEHAEIKAELDRFADAVRIEMERALLARRAKEIQAG